MSLRSNTQRRQSHRLSHRGFSPIPNDNVANMQNMQPGDATIDIPLHDMQNGQPRQNSATPLATTDNGTPLEEKTTSERQRGRMFGGRRIKRASTIAPGGRGVGYDGEEDTLNKMGRIYKKVTEFSTLTRYLVYVSPIAACIAIPIIVGATTAKGAEIGGVRIVWFFTWIEIVWLSLWTSKVVVHYFPYVFQFLAGVVSSGTRKYALILKALEIPLSLVGWAVTSLATFAPIMTRNPTNRANNNTGLQHWEKIMNAILGACVLSTLILLVEKFFIQLISVNYHRKQFNLKIKESKRNIYLLGLLYDASRKLFPMYCEEFAEEDYMIGDLLNIAMLSKGFGGSRGKDPLKRRDGTITPFRLIQDVGRFGDKVTSAFGNVAQEITGRQVFNPNSAHSIVVEALEKRRTSEALARRIWMSFVIEGREALYEEDIVDVLGGNHKQEAEEAFLMFDRDSNGDISLEEAVNTAVQLSRDRKALGSSMHDVDQAINVFDRILMAVCFVIVIFTFIGFLNTSFLTTLATAGTTLLSLSFVFSVTAQEFLGSCIFIFVKHPFDVGDRVDIGTDRLAVDHISLLFTVFRRVAGTDVGRSVQVPNNILNNLWIENVSRSVNMKEQLTLDVSFDTSFEDIQLLKQELLAFVTDKENSRDFLPDIDVEVLGTSDMSKLQLKIEIRHKGNYSNEVQRAARRSKFMCALVAALRRVPIFGPGGGSDALGGPDNPTYSVSVDDMYAKEKRDASFKTKDEARMVPKALTENALSPAISRSKTTSSPPVGLSATQNAIVQDLNHPSLGYDPGRDETWASRDDSSTLGGERANSNGQRTQDLEEVRSLLRRQSTRGKRRPGQDAPVTTRPGMPDITESSYRQTPSASAGYAPRPEATVQLDDYDAYRTQSQGLHASPDRNVSTKGPGPLAPPNLGPQLPTSPSAYTPEQQGSNYMQPYQSSQGQQQMQEQRLGGSSYTPSYQSSQGRQQSEQRLGSSYTQPYSLPPSQSEILEQRQGAMSPNNPYRQQQQQQSPQSLQRQTTTTQQGTVRRKSTESDDSFV